MKRWVAWIVSGVLVVILCTVSTFGLIQLLRPLAQEPTPKPTLTEFELDVLAVALIATYEARVFPEPLRSDAYRAVAWTTRNRVESKYDGATGYRDEELLTKYSSFKYHREDEIDPRAVEIALEVLTAPNHENDPTRGARHFVDNSYWTGTHEQRTSPRLFPWAPNDLDVQRLVASDRFLLVIEWQSSVYHPLGPLTYGLYFFDYWPPPAVPTPTATATSTRTMTPTRTVTPTRSSTPTRTRVPSRTPTRSKTPTTTPASTAMTMPLP